ncbi:MULTISPECIES: YibE/F family protein [Clostridium]|uniref:YibE/F family protein n=1 Tax=Clostridium TaxID=1485 RepID=UPI0008246410|nr:MULTISPECIES: YibE/F family protein [Clostridium]
MSILQLKSKIVSYKYKSKKNITLFIIIITACILGIYFVNSNETLYQKSIAKISSISETNFYSRTSDGKYESMKKQHITAVIMNGTYIGKKVKLENTVSYSGVNNINFKTNDEVFISTPKIKGKTISSKILDLKRDTYVLYIILIFILFMIIIGGIKGIRSIGSVLVNILIYFSVIELFLHNFNLIFIFITSALLFTLLSLFIVGGVNRKTISAVISTLTGTTITIIIALLTIKINNARGVRFEELEFLTHPPEKIFYIELLIGTLGAVMDIAISISSAINELYTKNPSIKKSSLIKSGFEIGKDIMGTMSNTMLFAYISGSIPMILLLLRNRIPVYNILSENLSLEIIRALTGSIGIVISIPISIFISIELLKHKLTGGLRKS